MIFFFTGNSGVFGTQLNIYSGAFFAKKLIAKSANVFAKKLHMAHGNTVKKIKAILKFFPSYVKLFVFILLMHILFCHTNQKKYVVPTTAKYN